MSDAGSKIPGWNWSAVGNAASLLTVVAMIVLYVMERNENRSYERTVKQYEAKLIDGDLVFTGPTVDSAIIEKVVVLPFFGIDEGEPIHLSRDFLSLTENGKNYQVLDIDRVICTSSETNIEMCNASSPTQFLVSFEVFGKADTDSVTFQS